MISIISKLLLFITILPFSTAFDAPHARDTSLVKKQSDPFYTSLLQVQSDFQQFYTDLNGIPTTQPITSSQASLINQDFQKLISDIKNATAICQKSKFNADLCKKYTDLLTNALTPFNNFINALIAHKNAIISAGYQSLVCNALKALLAALQALFECLIKNCCVSGTQCNLTGIAQKYYSLIAQAQSAFGC